MQTANIHCVDCGVDLLRDIRSQHIEAALLVCHAAVPHCGHTLHVHRNPAGQFATVRLQISCLHPQCKKLGAAEWDLDVDERFVNTYTLAFHTSHEGHRLRVWIDGTMIESPEQT